jgi:hypothetical protein
MYIHIIVKVREGRGERERRERGEREEGEERRERRERYEENELICTKVNDEMKTENSPPVKKFRLFGKDVYLPTSPK